MSIPDRASPDLELPEQHLLRDGDRIQEYACAFLAGELTAQQYSELTLAEISRRAPIDLPLVDLPPADLPLAEIVPVVRAAAPASVPPARVVRPQRTDADRSRVLAEAFVSGRVRGTDFLRLIRDC